MYRHLWLIALVCAALVATEPSLAQQPDQQPSVTFRSEVNYVEVHAIVTDEDGAFVRGLTIDDFEIYEAGRLQKPSVFSLIDLPVERPFTPLNAAEPIEPDVRETTRTFEGRIYVLVLDDLHTRFTRTRIVQDTAKQFIRKYFGANDLAAVVYTSGRQDAGQELTANRRMLLAAIDRYQGMKIGSASQERMGRHLSERGAELAVALAEDDFGIRSNEGVISARATPDPLELERASNARRSLGAIENVSKWLSDVQGRRKALLFFSEGIDYDVYKPFDRGGGAGIVSYARDAAGAAQRANVNVYAIDPRGLDTFGDLIDIRGNLDYPQLEFGPTAGAYRELLLSQESLITLADETGGLAVVRTNNVAEGLGRIVLDNSRYYLLGYLSDSGNWSNKFLKLDIRAKRPGLKVRARHGFMPPNPRDAAKALEAAVKTGATPALTAALSKPVPVGELPMRVTAASFRGADDNSSVLISLEIDGAALMFLEDEGRFYETIEVSILAADQKAKIRGGDNKTHTLKLLPETRDRVAESGVRFLSRLELPPARYQIRIGAHATNSGAVSTVPFDLEVPDYAKETFSMSNAILSSPGAASLPTANPDPEFDTVLSGPPIATRRFSSSDTVASFVEVYERATSTPHAINFAATVQDATDARTVFSARDRRQVEASTMTVGHGFRTDIPLQDFPAGTYVLRLEATAGDKTARRDVLFDVR
jgi:VWFA-related protein